MNNSNSDDRLLGIYLGLLVGAFAGMGLANFFELVWFAWPIMMLPPTVLTGALFGRFPWIARALLWLWVFPFGFEDRLLGGKKNATSRRIE